MAADTLTTVSAEPSSSPEKRFTTPRFSATKTAPSGAKRTATGVLRPEKATFSTNSDRERRCRGEALRRGLAERRVGHRGDRGVGRQERREDEHRGGQAPSGARGFPPELALHWPEI